MEKGSLPLLDQLEAARVAALVKERDLRDLKEKLAGLQCLLRQVKNQGKRKSTRINMLRRELEGLKEQVQELLDITDSFDHERVRCCQEREEFLGRIEHHQEVLEDLEEEIACMGRRRRRNILGCLLLGSLAGFIGGVACGK